MKLYTKDHKIFKENGEIFFFCADTAWEIFHKLTFDEAKYFIDNRAEKGYNALQCVAVAELDGLHTPTYEGKLLPFSDLENLTVNEAYFDHVKRVIEYANSKGIFMTVVPMWGCHIVPNLAWGNGVKPVFNDPDKAYKFLKYLANKLKGLDVIWMLGGDRPFDTPERRAVIAAMAKAIREVSGHDQLITAHTQGGLSLWDMLEQPDYLDFVTWQTGHMGQCYPSWRPISQDYKRLPIPVLNSEPCYESHPIMASTAWERIDNFTRFSDKEVRRCCYWSVFSGGAGITYGCYGIWQMRRPEDENNKIPESAASAYSNDTIPYWYDSLNFPAAFQIPYLKRFIEKLPNVQTLRPAPELLLSDNPTDERHVEVLSNETHDFIAAYIPEPLTLTLDVSVFKGPFNVFWFDPRYNIYNAPKTENSERQFFNIATPTTGGDYVLLLTRK